ncbi:hypothetical protein COLO4_04995 [Corchorus olitorius]|uniref:Uncharacterized protein n=1 Tax=Corchorus olitorius TaxID=93759 RepID=A0A1R3KS85_9ROSI|nr:hypothetical protein COLO4_04995 [Corchorus olitorius]
MGRKLSSSSHSLLPQTDLTKANQTVVFLLIVGVCKTMAKQVTIEIERVKSLQNRRRSIEERLLLLSRKASAKSNLGLFYLGVGD